MTYNNLARTLAAITLLCTASIGLSGCGTTAPGELGQNQRLLETCSPDTKVNSVIQWDGTNSGRTDQIDMDRLKIVEEVARKTAVCNGHLTASVFSAGSGATVTVYDGELNLPGSTENSRLRRVPDAVAEIMHHIRGSYAQAIASLPSGGTDINGLYRLASEQQAQLGDGYQLNFLILTDGFHNLSGVVLDNQELSPEQAVMLADQVNVPELPGAVITVAGLGRVAGEAAPSELVEGLVAYYDRLCENTGAASCLSVTDWR